MLLGVMTGASVPRGSPGVAVFGQQPVISLSNLEENRNCHVSLMNSSSALAEGYNLEQFCMQSTASACSSRTHGPTHLQTGVIDWGCRADNFGSGCIIA